MNDRTPPHRRGPSWWHAAMTGIDDWAFGRAWIPDRAYKLIERLTVGRGL